MSAVRTSLARHLPRSPADEREIRSMAAAAWRERGLALIDPADIRDDWIRQAVINEANRLYGRRRAS